MADLLSYESLRVVTDPEGGVGICDGKTTIPISAEGVFMRLEHVVCELRHFDSGAVEIGEPECTAQFLLDVLKRLHGELTGIYVELAALTQQGAVKPEEDAERLTSAFKKHGIFYWEPRLLGA